jgi:uncharacterized membrane protein
VSVDKGPADTVSAEPAGAAPPHVRYPRLRRYLRRLDHIGVLLGLISFVCSLTPSLLPRSWEVQGIVSGIGAPVHTERGW